MNIEKYQILKMIGQKSKLSEIAAKLTISQPTVSFHLKSLEKEFNLKLFDLNNKQVTLTKEGQLLLPYVNEILALHEALCKKVSNLQSDCLDVRIGSTLSPGVTLLPSFLPDYLLSHPNHHITIEVASAKIITERILDYQYDFGLISANEEIPDSLNSNLLFEDPLVFVFSPKYKYLFDTDPTLAFISQMNFIHHSENSSTRRASDLILKELNLYPKSCITVNSVEIIRELVSNSCGISILPSSLIHHVSFPNEICSMPIPSSKAVKKVSLIYHKKQVLTPEVIEFIDCLTRSAL